MADLTSMDEPVVDHDDFRPMLRALTRAQGFAMYFAESNLPSYRRRVADALRERLDRTVVDVDLSDVDRRPERPTIDYILEGRLEDVPGDAVAFVWGLEHLLPSTDVDEAVTEQTLTEVNWRRGAYERLERPLVFWLPEYAVRSLAREAPDFFDWNSGLYVFDAPDAERADLFEASLLDLDGDTEVESLPVSEKRAREAYLRALKDEYDGDSHLDRAARADVLHRLGRLYASRNEYAQATEALEKALALFEETQNRSGEAATRHGLATIALRQGEYERARAEFGKSLEIKQEIGDRSGEASTRHNLASIAVHQGEYDRAREEFGQSLEIKQEIGNRSGEASTRHNLATIALRQGEYDRAREEFGQSLEIKQEIGNRSGEASTRHQLATIALEQGEYERARSEFGEALSIRREIGDRSGEAATFAQLGVLAAEGVDRVEPGLRLLLLAYVMLSGIGHARQQTAWDWVTDLASRLDWSQDDLEAAAQEVQAAYDDDGGWGLVRAAFESAEG